MQKPVKKGLVQKGDMFEAIGRFYYFKSLV